MVDGAREKALTYNRPDLSHVGIDSALYLGLLVAGCLERLAEKLLLDMMSGSWGYS
jgi:hypothetical protein